MAHVTHKLTNSFEGALAGGGDPATSPLYVFGPFLKLIVVAGVAQVTFGASVWLAVLTVVVVSFMYRFVMTWVTDGSGGSGLNEEEFGGWAVKVNAGITLVEYTLTFLVSIAALVTFVSDRAPILDGSFFIISYRTLLAVILSILVGWVVNRGPKAAARTFGPATLAVLVLLWVMVIATVWKLGLHLPSLNPRGILAGFRQRHLCGYARILALMTGIEIFANLVAAFEGTAREKSQKAFGSLIIVMGTTSITMLVVGPAFLQLSDPTSNKVSVFTQTMDKLLPEPLPYVGTLIGVIVLGSAAAASAQGLQNLALGLRYRHYVPAPLGQRNRFDVADKPVWIEVALVSACFILFGTSEETYLAIYAAGVFVLLSMTGWACAKRLRRQLREKASARGIAALIGVVLAATLTSGATAAIFAERFLEGAWTYLIFIPVLYMAFSAYRNRLGAPLPLEDHIGRIFVGQYLLPFQREGKPEDKISFRRIVVPIDGSTSSELALAPAELFCHVFGSRLTLVAVKEAKTRLLDVLKPDSSTIDLREYLRELSWEIQKAGVQVDFTVRSGSAPIEITGLARDIDADLIVISAYGPSGIQGWFVNDMANEVAYRATMPVLLIRPTEEWHSRRSRFKKLLVTLDGSEGAEQVLRYARAVARALESEIVLLTIPETDAEVPSIRRYLESVAVALRERGFVVRTMVSGSGAARTIVSIGESEVADVIMMARRGRGGLDRETAIGSVADNVVQTTTCPVFLVPATSLRSRTRSAKRSGPAAKVVDVPRGDD